MKKSVIVLFVLLLIAAAWVIGFWVIGPESVPGIPGVTRTPTPGTSESPPPGSPDDPDPLETPGESQWELDNRRDIMLEEAIHLFKGYFFDEALALLRDDETLINDDTELVEASILQAIDSLVLYQGDVKHIFTHTLILFPEYLYRNIDTPQGGYAYFLYQRELARALPLLYERGYVLYDINDLFEKDAEGNMQRRNIYLPPGKMPLILSIDDPGYENAASHGGIGFPNRIVIDENGELATEVKTPEGETLLTYDGDVFLMVDNFVKENPGFSWRGAKGIIAATGVVFDKASHGLFGYDFNKDENAREIAKEIADKIKENGWLFASHSFTHSTATVMNNTAYDTNRWNEIHGPILGRPNIFIAPAGILLGSSGMQVLKDNGIDIYCTVDNRQQIERIGTPMIVMGRIEISWFSLVRFADILNRDFFDVTKVIDSHRPPLRMPND